MTLKDCTKEELLYIIGRFDIYDRGLLDRFLSEVNYNRERKRLEEAGKAAEEAREKRVKYFELLKPYEGKPILDVPISVINEAERLMKEAQRADEKWAKLMNI